MVSYKASHSKAPLIDQLYGLWYQYLGPTTRPLEGNMDRPLQLCEFGLCVLNGPGIEGGDCVCDGKPTQAQVQAAAEMVDKINGLLAQLHELRPRNPKVLSQLMIAEISLRNARKLLGDLNAT